MRLELISRNYVITECGGHRAGSEPNRFAEMSVVMAVLKFKVTSKTLRTPLLDQPSTRFTLYYSFASPLIRTRISVKFLAFMSLFQQINNDYGSHFSIKFHISYKFHKLMKNQQSWNLIHTWIMTKRIWQKIFILLLTKYCFSSKFLFLIHVSLFSFTNTER